MEEIQPKLTIVWFLNSFRELSEFEATNIGQFPEMKFFKDPDECISFITSCSDKNTKFSLFICDYSKSEIVVTTLDKFSQIVSIFLLWNESEEENYNSMQHHWIKECTKVSRFCSEYYLTKQYSAQIL
jgi:hypothetical protein